MSSVLTRLTGALVLSSSLSFADIPAVAAQNPPPPVEVWYMGHCGFAVRVGEKLLVFDYLSERGTRAEDLSGGGFADGAIDPADLAGLDVYVFVTHSHSDHYDPAILAWADHTENIQYFFGWEAGDDPEHHYLVGPRATAEVDGLQAYTINSHHSGVPEVAYLVQVEGRWIYHNGDYRQDYLSDFPYLRTLTDHMDVAFTAGLHDERWQYTHQAHYLMEHFQPCALFPMHHGDQEEEGEAFARVMAERGYSTFIPVPLRRGDHWVINGGITM
jgi:L-ascorbate metabolism protein UlaG (beta-lactamase superfamily)